MEINNYLIDTAQLVEGGMKMVSYRVAAFSSESAMEKFLEGNGTVIYEGEVTQAIIIGLEKEK